MSASFDPLSLLLAILLLNYKAEVDDLLAMLSRLQSWSHRHSSVVVPFVEAEMLQLVQLLILLAAIVLPAVLSVGRLPCPYAPKLAFSLLQQPVPP